MCVDSVSNLYKYCTANFLLELIMIKNNHLRIGQTDNLFSYDELQSIIDCVCLHKIIIYARLFYFYFGLIAMFLYFVYNNK